MTDRAYIRTTEDLRSACSALYRLEKPFKLAWQVGENRSLDQNRLAFKWYAEVGQQSGQTSDEIHRYAKLTFGCPILCRDDPVFNGFFTLSIAPLSYERQLKAMTYLSVSSILSVKQMTEYLSQFERHYRGEGLQLSETDAV